MRAPEAARGDAGTARTEPRGRLSRWGTELALGARLSVSGGRGGWARLALISVGVGLGVAMLLIAASVPTLMSARNGRIDARNPHLANAQMPKGDDTALVKSVTAEYRDLTIKGRMLQPEGERAPLPPGVDRQLRPGDMVVSPALARLLASDEGALLRGRWGERVVGTIGRSGLSGPEENTFYLGTDRLTTESADRIKVFGTRGNEKKFEAVLLMLIVVALVVLLVPVAVFLSTAVRFGGEARDRQLAALRLVGADAAMTRRIAAGDTLLGALLGLATGTLLFLVTGLVAGEFMPAALSFYRADFRPVPMLALLIAVLVPAVAVLITVSALRRVVLEPLGVVRRSRDRRRRLWWRLILPVSGIALLYPLRSGLDGRSDGFEYQVMAGVAALLIGVALLLPWVVEATVQRLGGGGVAWQLAVRRLQLDSGTAVRAVSGIAVAVAGVIALQGLLTAVQAQYTTESGSPTDRFQATVTPQLTESTRAWRTAFDGVRRIRTTSTVSHVLARPVPASDSGFSTRVRVGDCAVLRQFATLGECRDGDAFVVAVDNVGASLTRSGEAVADSAPTPGTAYVISPYTESNDGPEVRWTLPTGARTVPQLKEDLPQGSTFADVGQLILVTPAAAPAELLGPRSDLASATVYAALDPADPDALDRLRNAAAKIDPSAYVTPVQSRAVEAVLVNVKQGLLVGVGALLLLIGASILVNVVEQMRERRRLLAVLVAFGTRRSVLAGSVLYQAAIPVLLGLAMAVTTGAGLAAILQKAAEAPVRFDWAGIAATSGTAAAVVVLTTAASLPLLWRLTKPGGLRSE